MFVLYFLTVILYNEKNAGKQGGDYGQICITFGF